MVTMAQSAGELAQHAHSPGSHAFTHTFIKIIIVIMNPVDKHKKRVSEPGPVSLSVLPCPIRRREGDGGGGRGVISNLHLHHSGKKRIRNLYRQASIPSSTSNSSLTVGLSPPYGSVCC